MECTFERTVEEPAHKAECKHILALHHALEVEAAVGEGGFHHGGHRHLYHFAFQPDFFVRLVGGVESLVEIGFLEGVDIYDCHATVLQEFHVLLECGRIHRHEYVGFVTGGIYTLSDVYLEARNTA